MHKAKAVYAFLYTYPNGFAEVRLAHFLHTYWHNVLSIPTGFTQLILSKASILF